MNKVRREVLKAGGGVTVMALAVAAGPYRPEEALAPGTRDKAEY